MKTERWCDTGHWTHEPVVGCQEGWYDGPSWTSILCPRHLATHIHTGDKPCVKDDLAASGP